MLNIYWLRDKNIHYFNMTKTFNVFFYFCKKSNKKMTLLFTILAIILGYKVLKILLEIIYGKKNKKKSDNKLFKRRF